MIFKYNCGDIVEHEKYGSGLVKQRWLSASGVNELYDVLFIKGLSTCLLYTSPSPRDRG